jgi:dolichol-phosphate mannosyltransferase
MSPALDDAVQPLAREDVVDVSVVVPCRAVDKTLPTLVAEVEAVLAPRTERVEFVLVADASDADAAVIDSLAARDRRVRALRLSRRGGQHIATAAGLQVARGAVVVVMDGDLQHRPTDVPRLIDALDDADVAIARRATRSEGLVVRLGSAAFFALLSVVVGVRLDPALSSFSALRRGVVDALPHGRGAPRHHLLEVLRAGHTAKTVTVAFPARAAGTSAYALAHRVVVAVDLLIVARPALAALALPLGVASVAGVASSVLLATTLQLQAAAVSFGTVLATMSAGAALLAWRCHRAWRSAT